MCLLLQGQLLRHLSCATCGCCGGSPQLCRPAALVWGCRVINMVASTWLSSLDGVAWLLPSMPHSNRRNWFHLCCVTVLICFNTWVPVLLQRAHLSPQARCSKPHPGQAACSYARSKANSAHGYSAVVLLLTSAVVARFGTAHIWNLVWMLQRQL
ncbi:hypothetical protein COO60DRAFT_1486400 [Scenedesmus sp. NREL 46B-D3]|nr:hypothetical protein COO60DRAFT_1486400 [Scenedesmus sp. NREL 46B-D3]